MAALPETLAAPAYTAGANFRIRHFLRCKTIAGILCFLCACSVKRNDKRTAINFYQTGLGEYNTFIYSVQQSNAAGDFTRTDTLGLFCSDRAIPDFDNQTCMQWQVLSLDSNRHFLIPVKTYNNSVTGIEVTDSLLYIHPPREGRFKILQFCPHPLFHRPDKAGCSWAWDLEIGKSWAIDSLYPIAGTELFHTTYRFTDTVTLTGITGGVFCYHILARGTSVFGTSTASYYLSLQYGLVKADITATNGQTFSFTLIAKMPGPEGLQFNALFADMYRHDKVAQWQSIRPVKAAAARPGRRSAHPRLRQP